MNDKIYDNWNAIMYIPPIIITIVNCILQDAWYLFILILPIIMVWCVVLIGIQILFASLKPKFDKKLVDEIINDLNIDRREWRKSSEEEKAKFHSYLIRQNRFKFSAVQNRLREERNKIKDYKKLLTFNQNEGEYKKILQQEVYMQWKDLSLEERIKLISMEEVKEKKDKEQSRIYFENLQIEKKELADKKEKERIKKEEQDKLQVEEENRKKAKEQAKREEFEKEELLKNAEIRKQIEIEERLKRKDEQFKERVKRDLLEKERKKQLESDAIQELIESGKLSYNFSLKNIRVPIPSHIMQAVWKRDMKCCVTCGSGQSLEFDHIIPVAKGGSNSINNIQLLCQKCNRTKSSKIM